MTEERVTETETPSGNVHTTHTVIHDDGTRRRGGAGWLIALLILIVAIAAIYLFSRQSDSEVLRDNAVAEAANEVGEAAQNVGEAAQDAGEAAKDAVDGN